MTFIQKTVFVFLAIPLVCYAAPRILQFTECIEIFPDAYELEPIFQVIDVVSYVDGSLTYTFPNGFFDQAPVVTLAIQDADLVSTNTSSVSAWIVENNPSYVKICATYEESPGITREVPTNGVMIHISAIGKRTVLP